MLLHIAAALFLNCQPSIEVSSPISLIDEEISIHIENLNPNEKYWIEAETLDGGEAKWSSSALYQSDENGKVQLESQPSLEGSYIGIDGMGLFSSMQSTAKMFKLQAESRITLNVVQNSEKLASSQITRLKKSPNVQRISIKEDGLVGILFLPPSEKPLPLIICLTGSNGGFSENSAQLFASHGFAAFALGYFGAEGLPSNLENIPMEYFERALNWIKKQPAINSGAVGLYGGSKGGELALILGTLFPDSIHAIVASVPSSVIYPGLGKYVHAWTYHGKPIAPFAEFLLLSNLENGRGQSPDHPVAATEDFIKGMENRKDFEAAAIPVEKICCPILLLSGGDDQVWPSSIYANQIVERLKMKGSTISCTHLYYPKAGHRIGIPYLPESSPLYFHPFLKIWLVMGGTAQEDELACRDSWKKLVTFFSDSLLNQFD